MNASSTNTVPEAPARRRPGLFRTAWRFGRTKVGVVLTGLIVLIAVVGPFIAPYTPTEFVARPFEADAAGAMFGGDNRGRDVLTRFLWGGWTLLLLAGAAAGIGVAAGTVVGIVAGYRRGWVDDVLMRTNDVLLAFPQLIAALLVMSIIGPKVWLIVAVIAVSHMPRVARVIREATRKVIEQDYVKAAEAIGLPRWRIMVVEILPNVTSPLLVELGLRLTYSIGVVAVLGFLGMGLQPPTADWGLMINENRQGMAVQPWAVALPVTAIAILTVGANLITDGLSRAAIGIDRGVEK
ncbi:ABC transporter permease [Nocardiopsis alba]|uniref:ABC transporter permease n=2 Tax=Nocardiopsis alba TaxID=53437 RepID=A0ABV5DUL2_9ACTN|nr:MULTISPECIES: ABC transporter permease [Nocardiopsis]AFR07925.1 N-terminal TM domain of oligopeptide transport permease C family protein [Nocardiopsis alba ATCC BAA-2165]MEC3895879.1 ABC transporter permease [Nocardiopsis sp. LDBS1602]